jgi:L-asparaginase/Glu-tRNA(Gln) amidotransferase subunit D
MDLKLEKRLQMPSSDIVPAHMGILGKKIADEMVKKRGFV